MPQADKQHPAQRLIDKSRLEVILSYLEGVDANVTASLKRLSLSTKSVDDINNGVHDILQAFNEPFEENEEVLVISLGMTTVDCPGMLPEEKVNLVA